MQFLVISGRGVPKINIKDVKLSPFNMFSLLMLDVIRYHNFPERKTWVITDESSNSIDVLSLDATHQISNGLNLSETRLGALLGILVMAKCSFMAWTDNRYASLKDIDNPILLVDVVYKHLDQGQLHINYKGRSEAISLRP